MFISVEFGKIKRMVGADVFEVSKTELDLISTFL